MDHYCSEHQTPYRKYEKNGNSWYSHALANGGYHNEPKEAPSAPKPQAVTDFKSESMFMCNAMNNAVALVNGGKTNILKLDSTYKRILAILEGKKEPEDLDNWPDSQ